MTSESFSSKRVLVTGGYGFIGSHLVRRLKKEQAEVAILVRRSSNPWRLKDLENDIKIFYADLTDATLVNDAIERFKPHFIFHLAAYGTNNTDQDVLEAINVNMGGIVNLIKAAKSVSCEKIINLGSSSEYGNKHGSILETTHLEPVDLYGSTKAAGTLIGHQLSSEYDLPFVTLRPFGIFGEAEEGHKLFGHIFQSLLKNQDVPLTNCEHYRDYMYVGNLIDALVTAASKPTLTNDIFNLGTGQVRPLKDYVELIFKHMNTRNKPLYGVRPLREKERSCPIPDIQKVTTLLKWEPTASLEEGIIKTANWYKAHRELYTD